MRKALDGLITLAIGAISLLLVAAVLYSCRSGNNPQSKDDVPYGHVEEAPDAGPASAAARRAVPVRPAG
jgi:hypothetical protein